MQLSPALQSLFSFHLGCGKEVCQKCASILVGLLRKSSGTQTFGNCVAVAILVCQLFYTLLLGVVYKLMDVFPGALASRKYTERHADWASGGSEHYVTPFRIGATVSVRHDFQQKVQWHSHSLGLL